MFVEKSKPRKNLDSTLKAALKKKKKALQTSQIDNLIVKEHDPSRLKRSDSRTQSDVPESRKLKIINFNDTSIYKSVVLNLNSEQSFQVIIQDLGEMVAVRNPSKMLTRFVEEITSLEQLFKRDPRENLFYITSSDSQTKTRAGRRHRSEPNVKSTYLINKRY